MSPVASFSMKLGVDMSWNPWISLAESVHPQGDDPAGRRPKLLFELCSHTSRQEKLTGTGVTVDSAFDGCEYFGHLLPLVEEDRPICSTQSSVGVGPDSFRGEGSSRRITSATCRAAVVVFPAALGPVIMTAGKA